MSSEGILTFSWSDLRQSDAQLGSDGKEGITYLARCPKKYEGTVLGLDVHVKRHQSMAVKTFKVTKSIRKILLEANMQQTCASVQASPPVYGVHLEEKYIAMQALDTLPAKTYANNTLPDDIQYMICALMARLDSVKIMHNDGNALNIMLDERGRPYIIDLGLAKKITPKVLRKHGAHPNISVTLWGLVRGFKRCKVSVPIMDKCVKADDPSDFILDGERLLTSFEMKQNKIKKRRKK